MKGITRLLNLIVALLIMVIVLLIFWFLIARYVHGYSASGTISYMLDTMEGWRDAVVTWFTGLVS